jgi:hypothetical protein
MGEGARHAFKHGTPSVGRFDGAEGTGDAAHHWAPRTRADRQSGVTGLGGRPATVMVRRPRECP